MLYLYYFLAVTLATNMEVQTLCGAFIYGFLKRGCMRYLSTFSVLVHSFGQGQQKNGFTKKSMTTVSTMLSPLYLFVRQPFSLALTVELPYF